MRTRLGKVREAGYAKRTHRFPRLHLEVYIASYPLTRRRRASVTYQSCGQKQHRGSQFCERILTPAIRVGCAECFCQRSSLYLLGPRLLFTKWVGGKCWTPFLQRTIALDSISMKNFMVTKTVSVIVGRPCMRRTREALPQVCTQGRVCSNATTSVIALR